MKWDQIEQQTQQEPEDGYSSSDYSIASSASAMQRKGAISERRSGRSSIHSAPSKLTLGVDFGKPLKSRKNKKKKKRRKKTDNRPRTKAGVLKRSNKKVPSKPKKSRKPTVIIEDGDDESTSDTTIED